MICIERDDMRIVRGILTKENDSEARRFLKELSEDQIDLKWFISEGEKDAIYRMDFKEFKRLYQNVIREYSTEQENELGQIVGSDREVLQSCVLQKKLSVLHLCYEHKKDEVRSLLDYICKQNIDVREFISELRKDSTYKTYIDKFVYIHRKIIRDCIADIKAKQVHVIKVVDEKVTDAINDHLRDVDKFSREKNDDGVRKLFEILVRKQVDVEEFISEGKKRHDHDKQYFVKFENMYREIINEYASGSKTGADDSYNELSSGISGGEHHCRGESRNDVQMERNSDQPNEIGTVGCSPRTGISNTSFRENGDNICNSTNIELERRSFVNNFASIKSFLNKLIPPCIVFLGGSDELRGYLDSVVPKFLKFSKCTDNNLQYVFASIMSKLTGEFNTTQGGSLHCTSKCDWSALEQDLLDLRYGLFRSGSEKIEKPNSAVFMNVFGDGIGGEKCAKRALLCLCELIISCYTSNDMNVIKEYIDGIIDFGCNDEKINDYKIQFLLPLLICVRGKCKFTTENYKLKHLLYLLDCYNIGDSNSVTSN